MVQRTANSAHVRRPRLYKPQQTRSRLTVPHTTPNSQKKGVPKALTNVTGNYIFLMRARRARLGKARGTTMTNILDIRPHTHISGPICDHYEDALIEGYCDHDSCKEELHDDCDTCFEDGADAALGQLDPFLAELMLPSPPDKEELDYFYYATRNVDPTC